MKLRRLRIESFRRFREPCLIDDFTDGINLFAAPNESGKSTIVEAIRAAFFERHRSSSVEHLRPWGDAAATPSVEVEFEFAGKSYRLAKAFLGRKRCSLVIDGRTLDGAAAEDHLGALLGFTFPGKGASTPDHMGIPGLLWIRQGSSHELAGVVSHAADQLRQVLGGSLGDLTSSTGDALLRAVELARNELLTPAAGTPRASLANALKGQAELQEKLASLDRDIEAYRSSVDRLAMLRSEHLREEQEQPWAPISQQHRAALAQLDAAKALEGRQAGERASLQQWSAQIGLLRTQAESFGRDEEAVRARALTLQAAQAGQQAAQAELDAWDRHHQAASDAELRARQRLERVRAAAARSDMVRQGEELEAALHTLADALAKAREERARLARLQTEAETLAVPAVELQRLRQLSDELRDLTVRLDAAATTIDFDLRQDVQARVDGAPTAGRARRTVLRRTEIEIDGVGRITIAPGGPELDALASRRDALSAKIEALHQQLGVAGLAEAEERTRTSAQRLRDAQACQKLLDVLAPRGVEALEAQSTSRTARLAEVRAAIAALPARGDRDEDLPNLPEAQAAASRAAEALQVAASALGEARLAWAKAQRDHDAARQELASAETSVRDPQRAERIAAVRLALADALAQEAAARQRVAQIDAQLQAVNPGLLHQDVERLARSVRELEDAHERRRTEITRLEVELETRGALGLEEQRAEHVRELELVARRAGELSRRAAALDHLLKLLREKRAALASRIRAPLQAHLEHYLQILFPGARIEVAEDLSPGVITRAGPRGAEGGGFEELSVGAREQMGIVARLAYADLLQQAGRPTLLILDDALVHTDDDRLGQMKRVLYDAATRHQILIFTCHPAAWRDLGVPLRPIGP